MPTQVPILYRVSEDCAERDHNACTWRSRYFTCTCPCAVHRTAWRKLLGAIHHELRQAQREHDTCLLHRRGQWAEHINRVKVRLSERLEEARYAGYQGT